MEDVSNVVNFQDDICEGCVTGKSSVTTFPKSSHGEVKTTSLLQLISSDVMGPILLHRVEQDLLLHFLTIFPYT